MAGKRSFFPAFTGIIAALSMAAPAAAESLWLDTVYPAAYDLPGDVEVLAVENFGGDAGPDVQIELLDRLVDVQIEGASWFILSDAGTLFDTGEEGAPDAVFRGSVRSEVIESRAEPRIDRKCVKRDEKKKCIERREVRVPCRELAVEIAPRISLVAPGGEQLYSHRSPVSAVQRWCRDQTAPSSIGMIDALIEDIALNIRSDLAPRNTRTSIRIMERRKGLKGDDRDAFKQAVKITDNDPYGACESFKALEASHPEHPSVLFNIGLCTEIDGQLDRAESYYNRVLAVDPGRDYAEQGLRRIDWQRRALDQIAARERSSGQS